MTVPNVELTGASPALWRRSGSPMGWAAGPQTTAATNSKGQDMKLSEQLKQDHECGDFGKALAGYAERAEALERDADRYRWLRAQHWSDSAVAVVSEPKQNVRLGVYCPSGDLLDEAIDAAMTVGAHGMALKTPNNEVRGGPSGPSQRNEVERT